MNGASSPLRLLQRQIESGLATFFPVEAALSMGLTPEIALGPRFIKLSGSLDVGKAAAKADKKKIVVSYPFN